MGSAAMLLLVKVYVKWLTYLEKFGIGGLFLNADEHS